MFNTHTHAQSFGHYCWVVINMEVNLTTQKVTVATRSGNGEKGTADARRHARRTHKS